MECFWIFSILGITLVSVYSEKLDYGLVSNCYKTYKEDKVLVSVDKQSCKKNEEPLNLYFVDEQIRAIDSNAFKNLSIEELVFENNGVDIALGSNSLTGLPNLLKLEFRSDAVFLAPQVFKPVENLQCLTISLGEVDITISLYFSSLKTIQKLIIFNTKVEYLDANRFFSIDKGVEILELNNCKITRILPKTFELFKNLRVLKLKFNQLTKIMDDTFYGLEKCLYSLSMKSNELTSIPANVLTKLSELQVLDLSFNHIKTISSHDFLNTRLWKLSLNNNLIAVLSYGMFTIREKTLKELYLQDNQISVITPGAFDGFKLGTLNLSSNALVTLDKNSFSGLKINKGILRIDKGVLDLSNNRIHNILPDAFDNSEIENIYLYNNPVKIDSRIRSTMSIYNVY